MKTKLTVEMTILILIGAAFGQVACAQNDGFGAYQVPPGRTTKPDHETADFIVFKATPQPTAKNGLFFLQKKGQFKDGAFLCKDAPYDGVEKSYSCWKLVPYGARVIKETLTVGLIQGRFCDGLREKFNTRGQQPKKIMEPEECPANEKCACYELEHECWDGAGYGAECPDDLRPIPEGARAPPGKGAGSGGSH